MDSTDTVYVPLLDDAAGRAGGRDELIEATRAKAERDGVVIKHEQVLELLVRGRAGGSIRESRASRRRCESVRRGLAGTSATEGLSSSNIFTHRRLSMAKKMKMKVFGAVADEPPPVDPTPLALARFADTLADVADSAAAALRRLSKELRSVAGPAPSAKFPDLGSLGEMRASWTLGRSDPGGSRL